MDDLCLIQQVNFLSDIIELLPFFSNLDIDIKIKSLVVSHFFLQEFDFCKCAQFQFTFLQCPHYLLPCSIFT